MRDNAKEEIVSEARLALAGADGVRDTILLMIRMNAADLLRNCYTYKSRVKDVGSLADKVLNRRQGSDERQADPGYTAMKARDVVGIRLLALHPSQITSITKSLIKFIKIGMSDDIALFEGPRLDNSIEEIIVYVGVNRSYSYDESYRYLRGIGLSPVGQNKKPKVKLVQSTQKRPYSSVHIVCLCRDINGRRGSPIPVEFQIRTPLEDVWAELDHPRNYKQKKQTGSFEVFRDRAADSMNILKSQLDVSLSSIENILKLYDQIDSGSSDVEAYGEIRAGQSVVWLTVAHNVSDKASPDIKQAISEADRGVDRCATIIERSGYANEELVPAIMQTLSEVSGVKKRYRRGGLDRHFGYWSGSTLGTLNTWLYRGMLALHGESSAALEILATAEKHFVGLIGSNPDDAYSHFRYGHCLMVGHAPVDSAIAQVRKAAKLVDSDGRKGLRGAVAGGIYHYLSWLLWTKRNHLRDLVVTAKVGKNELLQEQIELIQEALDNAFLEWAELQYMSASDVRRAVQKSRAVNHIFCFAWELHFLFGRDAMLFDEELIDAGRHHLDELSAQVSDLSDPKLDSAMRIAMLLGDRASTKKIVDCLNKKSTKWANTGVDASLGECLALANRWLRKKNG